jgi:hypothetical protein
MQCFKTNAWGVGGVSRILNPLEYDVPQAPKPFSNERELLLMVSFATRSLFVHMFSFGVELCQGYMACIQETLV